MVVVMAVELNPDIKSYKGDTVTFPYATTIVVGVQATGERTIKRFNRDS